MKNVITSLFLLLCLTCCTNNYTCPARTPFTGTTYGDYIEYGGALEVQYDNCAQPKKRDWGSLFNFGAVSTDHQVK